MLIGEVSKLDSEIEIKPFKDKKMLVSNSEMVSNQVLVSDIGHHSLVNESLQTLGSKNIQNQKRPSLNENSNMMPLL